MKIHLYGDKKRKKREGPASLPILASCRNSKRHPVTYTLLYKIFKKGKGRILYGKLFSALNPTILFSFPLTIFFGISLSSCSTYLYQSREKTALSLNQALKQQKISTCRLEKAKVFAGHSMKKEISQILNSSSFSFHEKAVLLSLYQIYIRPEKSSPTSDFSFLIKDDEKTVFYSFSHMPEMKTLFSLPSLKKNASPYSFPFFAGLEKIRTLSGANPSLKSSIQTLFSKLNTISLTPESIHFFKQNSGNLQANKSIKKFFFPGGIPLSTGEYYPKFSLESVYEHYVTKKRQYNSFTISEDSFLFPSHNKGAYLCSSSFYQKNKSLNTSLNNNEVQSFQFTSFGFKEGKKVFIGFLNQGKLKKVPYETFKGLPLILNPPSKGTPPTVCQINVENKNVHLVSSHGHLGLNHLKSFFPEGPFLFHTSSDILNKMTSPRFVISSSPLLAYAEIHRANEDQLHRLLNLKIPIVYTHNLGEMLLLQDEAISFDRLEEDNLTCLDN